MGYKITMSEIGPISLNETDPVKSILQNVSIILRTIKGSCPMYRGTRYRSYRRFARAYRLAHL